MSSSSRIIDINRSDIGRYLPRLVQIARDYYPFHFDIPSMIQRHIDAGGVVQLAMAKDRVLGFSVSSAEVQTTPFYRRPIPVIYQRLLYVDATIRKQQIGVTLQIAVLRHHLGLFWIFRRFALFCITDNPLIVRAFHLCDAHYPNRHQATPHSVVSFGTSLLPVIGGTALDNNLLVYGTNESDLKGFDYTDWWKNFLVSGHAFYDNLLLSTVFTARDGKILHNGVSLFVVGYAKPFTFVSRYFQVWWKRLGWKK